jgi:hypothetical protein
VANIGTIVLFVGTIGISACTADSSPTNQAGMAGHSDNGISGAGMKEVRKTVPLKSETPSTETDRLMLEQAAGACKGSEFNSFFEAAVRSKSVRTRYFTSPIKTGTGISSASSYHFPFQIMDYSYVTSDTVGKELRDWENVQLEFNQAQDERYRVDWVRINYGPNGDDEGETPDDDKTYGPRGYLIFKPTVECWALIEDGVER